MVVVDLDKLWSEFEPWIDRLFTGQKISTKDLCSMSSLVRNYCSGNGIDPNVKFSRKKGVNPYFFELIGRELYDRLKCYLKQYLDKFLDFSKNLVKNNLLIFYNQNWENYKKFNEILNKACSYLNSNWIKSEMLKNNDVREVYDTAMILWAEVIVGQLHQQIYSSLSGLIANDRSKKEGNSALISPLIRSYLDLGIHKNPMQFLNVYKKYFETLFLVDTERFYSSENSTFLKDNSVSDLIVYIDHRLSDEQRRVRMFFHKSSEKPLLSICETVLIEQNLVNFEREFLTILKERQDERLKLMYVLLKRVDIGFGNLDTMLEEHISQEGAAQIRKLETAEKVKPEQYVENLLEVYGYYEQLVLKAFDGHSLFTAALDQASRQFINEDKSPELFAQYCDFMLKKSPKNLRESQINEALKNILNLFKYIVNKYAFENLYIKLFSKRLIGQSSACDNSEIFMINELSKSCNYEIVYKLRVMYKDIQDSRELSKQFRSNVATTDFSVLAISTKHWPKTRGYDTYLSLPTELHNLHLNFAKFYINCCAKTRKLDWCYNMTRGEIVTNGFQKEFTFIVTAYQMVILLKYNDQLSYRMEELLEATEIEPEMFFSTLQQLINAKLLSCTDKDLKPDSVLNLSTNYNNTKNIVNLNRPIKPVGTTEGDEFRKEMQLKAVIIKIIKKKETLCELELISNIMEYLKMRFIPKLQTIKESIEKMIRLGYLKRSEHDNDQYESLLHSSNVQI